MSDAAVCDAPEAVLELLHRRDDLYLEEENATDVNHISSLCAQIREVDHQLQTDHSINPHLLIARPHLRTQSDAHSAYRTEANLALDKQPYAQFISSNLGDDVAEAEQFIDETLGTDSEGDSDDDRDDRPDYVRVYNTKGTLLHVRESGALYLSTSTRSEWRVTPSLSSRLHPHQLDALSTIKNNMDMGRGTLIAHCMGAGKTFTALACTAITHKRAIILCGVSVLQHWIKQIEVFSELGMDAWQFRHLSTTSRNTNSHWHRNGGVLLFGYDEFRNCVKDFNFPTSPFMFIVDEAHTVLSNKTLVSTAIAHLVKTSLLDPTRILLLSGTPMRNNLIGLYNLIHVIAPGVLGKSERFKTRFSNIIENSATPTFMRKCKLQVLRQLLVSSGIVTFRAQDEILSQLPPKQDFVLWHASCESKQSGITEMHVAQHAMTQIKVKIARALIVHIQTQHPDDGIIIFSKYLAHLKELQGLHPGPIIEGCVHTSRRDTIIDDLTRHKILYVSINAGSVGIDLSISNRVIIMNTGWSMADTEQAVSRCYRVGQQKTVYVYRIISEASIESRAYLQSVAQKHAHALSIFAPVELVHTPNSSNVKRRFKLTRKDLDELDPGLRRVRRKLLTAVESHTGYMQTRQTTVASIAINEANLHRMTQTRVLVPTIPNSTPVAQLVFPQQNFFKYPCQCLLVPPVPPVLNTIHVANDMLHIRLFAPGFLRDTAQKKTQFGFQYQVRGLRTASDTIHWGDYIQQCDWGYHYSDKTDVLIVIKEIPLDKFRWFVVRVQRVVDDLVDCYSSEWSDVSAVFRARNQNLFPTAEKHPFA